MSIASSTKRIYLDYASATPVDARVKRVMAPYEEEVFGNPSAPHEEGRKAKQVVGGARTKIARLIGSRAEEIIFTSGGTEGNNLAILGSVRALMQKGRAPQSIHIVRSSIEHASVIEPMNALEKEGVRMSVAPVTPEGIIDLGELKGLLTPDTVLVSVMCANNEIGTIQPIRDVARVIAAYKEERGGTLPLYLHADASQAPLFIDCSVERLGVDLLTVDAQKLYGPKGIGFVYVRRTVEVAPLMYGGGQEGAKRPGTENVPLVVGLAEAFSLACAEREEATDKLVSLRDYFIEELLKRIPGAEINGSVEDRLPSNVSISIPRADGEFLVVALDTDGVAAATGSACSALGGKEKGIVEALGKSREVAMGTIRFTLGKETTKEELQIATEKLQVRVEALVR